MAPMIKTPFINLRTDFGFKRLFASEERKHILIRFLNALLGDSMTVTDVDLRNPEQQPDSPDGKRIIYDVFFKSHVEFGEHEPSWIGRHKKFMKALGQDFDESMHHHFILEMQNLNQPPFEERLLYYSSREISEQGRAGAAYLLSPVVTIAITNFNFAHLTPTLKHEFRLTDSKTGDVLTDKLRILLLSLVEVRDWDECETELERLLFLIKNMDKMDKESKAYKCRAYDELFEAADTSAMACEDTVIYERDLRKLEEMNAGALYAAEVAREEGREQGREQGREEGREERIKQIIRQFYAGGFTCETIADTLCLPISEIKKILGI